MAKQETDFLVQAAILDRYVHIEQPEADLVGAKVIAQRLRESADLERYFFGQKPSPGWARVLHENGVFASPPNVVLVEAGYQTPFWPQSDYLESVADQVPDVVMTVIREIRTNNPVIHDDLTRALLKLPASASVSAGLRVEEWLAGEYRGGWGLAEAAVALTEKWAKEGFLSEALHLLRVILRPIPAPRLQGSSSYVGAAATTYQDLRYLRPSLWHETMPALIKVSPPDLIALLEDYLLASLRLEFEARGDAWSDSSWLSYGWRSSMMDTDQDREEDLKEHLLTALRNALDQWVRTDAVAARPKVMEYLGGDRLILRRLGLYIIGLHASVFADVVQEQLLNPRLHDDLTAHNEYFFLLKNGLPALPPEARAEVLSIVFKGEDPQKAEARAERVSEEFGEDKDRYLRTQQDLWIRNRLFVARSSLDAKAEATLHNLLDKYGEPDHPEFLAWTSEVSWIRDVSPATREQLLSMPIDELLQYVIAWQPEAEREFQAYRTSRAGLAQEVADLLLTHPERYEGFIERLAEAEPVYSATVFARAQELCKKAQALPWAALLDLVAGCAQKRWQASDRSATDNFEARIAGMHLVREGLASENGIPKKLLEKVNEVLLDYSNDSSPDAEQDNPAEGYLGYRDPLTLSLNTVRPIALDCILRIVRRKFGSLQNTANPKQLLAGQVAAVLDEKLDPAKEPSWAVHCVFGQYIWLFASIDIDWLKQNKSRIFPLGDSAEDRRFFDAAWDSYLLFQRPSLPLLELLASEYETALDRLSRGKTTNELPSPVDHLSFHLLSDFLWKPYDLNEPDSCLNRLFAKGDRRLRGIATFTLRNLVSTIPATEMPKLWPAIRELWQWRVNALTVSAYPEEFSEEMENLSALVKFAPATETTSSLWPLIQVLPAFSGDYSVWKNLEAFLADRVEREPEAVMQFYRQMHEAEKVSSRPIRHYDEVSDKILRTLVRNRSTRREGKALIDMISRTGNPRYRPLYDEYT